MTIGETAKIVITVKAVYPRFYAKLTEQESDYMIQAWAVVLRPYSYEQANTGLQMYLRTDKNGFPPSPGQIIHGMEQVKELEHKQYYAALEKKIVEAQDNALTDKGENARIGARDF